jgi:hypothetical protein
MALNATCRGSNENITLAIAFPSSTLYAPGCPNTRKCDRVFIRFKIPLRTKIRYIAPHQTVIGEDAALFLLKNPEIHIT